jgi:hypothetical protein
MGNLLIVDTFITHDDSYSSGASNALNELTEPLTEYNIKQFKINNSNIKEYVDFLYKGGTKWFVYLNYNKLKGGEFINNYLEGNNGIGIASKILNTTKLKLMTPYGPFRSNSINIFTTLISYKLISSEYTDNYKTYNRRLFIYSLYILKSYYVYYKKINNIDIENNDINDLITYKLTDGNKVTERLTQEYLHKIYENYYVDNSTFSIWLQRLDGLILFIYNIIKVNAEEQQIEIDDTFTNIFYKLIFDNYILNLNMTTELINLYYLEITPQILKKNYDNIFYNWTNYILNTQYYLPFILTFNYAPLKVNYDILSGTNYYEIVESYINYNFVNNSINNYKLTYLDGFPIRYKNKNDIINDIIQKLELLKNN